MDESDSRRFDLFSPTSIHEQLSGTLREFVSREVEPQAAEHNRAETFNHALFQRAGELGFLGITIGEEYEVPISEPPRPFRSTRRFLVRIRVSHCPCSPTRFSSLKMSRSTQAKH